MSGFYPGSHVRVAMCGLWNIFILSSMGIILLKWGNLNDNSPQMAHPSKCPPPLWLDSWLKSDGDEHCTLPKFEHASTLGTEKKNTQALSVKKMLTASSHFWHLNCGTQFNMHASGKIILVDTRPKSYFYNSYFTEMGQPGWCTWLMNVTSEKVSFEKWCAPLSFLLDFLGHTPLFNHCLVLIRLIVFTCSSCVRFHLN